MRANELQTPTTSNYSKYNLAQLFTLQGKCEPEPLVIDTFSQLMID